MTLRVDNIEELLHPDIDPVFLEQINKVVGESAASKKKRRNVKAGKDAQKYGKRTEDAVDVSLEAYRKKGLLIWDATGPRTVTTWGKGGKRVTRNIGVGPPDRSIILKKGLVPGVNACQVEVKHFKKAVDTTKLSRVHQYRKLVECARFGGPAGYLIWWVKRQCWTYVPVQNVCTEGYGDDEKVRIRFEMGVKVPMHGYQASFIKETGSRGGVTIFDSPDRPLPEPDWLDLAIECAALPLADWQK